MTLDTMSVMLDGINYEEVKKLYDDAESRCGVEKGEQYGTKI